MPIEARQWDIVSRLDQVNFRNSISVNLQLELVGLVRLDPISYTVYGYVTLGFRHSALLYFRDMTQP